MSHSVSTAMGMLSRAIPGNDVWHCAVAHRYTAEVSEEHNRTCVVGVLRLRVEPRVRRNMIW